MKKLTDKERLQLAVTLLPAILDHNLLLPPYTKEDLGRVALAHVDGVIAAIRAEKAAKTRKPQDPKGGKP